MTYKEKIMRELKEFSDKSKGDFLLSYQQLKNEGKDNEWIYLALIGKDMKDWETYGFGLMFNDKYRKHINMKYNKRHTDEELKTKSIETILNETLMED